MPYVAVVGPGDETDEVLLATAYAVGSGVAARGGVVVCGGLGGVMAAACRGARAAGGVTLGLLPGTDRSVANPWVVIAVPTGLGEARNAVVVRTADVLVAVGGRWGTLSEIALACRAGTPVVAVHGWRVDDGAGGPRGVTVATDAANALGILDTLLAARGQPASTRP
ncbi:MAG TPA: TIGR00725 family protein [Mycobacteriales bacterium]|nr:TIGR00725 family protein [Mycobacteriales bacterium]